MSIQSPYLTQEEAADYARYESVDAFRAWADKVDLKAYKRSRNLLYRVDEIEIKIETWQPSKKGATVGSSTGQKMDAVTVDPLARFRKAKPTESRRKRNTS